MLRIHRLAARHLIVTHGFARQAFFTVLAIFATLAPHRAQGLDVVEFRADGNPQAKTVTGEVLAQADDGGLLLLGLDGRIWPLEPDDLLLHRQNDEPFTTYSPKQLAEQLREELGSSFQVLPTKHYLICYSTSLEYAQWCEHLFERLDRAFTTYWEKRKFPLTQSRFPLVVLVFEDRKAYQDYGRREVGEAIENIVGFYSLETNRVALYDPTPKKRREQRNRRRSTKRRRNRDLAQATGSFNVATIIHEATHQLAFNCGFHRRFADNPLWLTEGMALYFETPDPGSDDGWTKMGKINSDRLGQFRRSVARGRLPNTLRDLLTTDDLLRTPATALDAYAEAWALSYFLIRTKPQQYHAYLRKLNAKPPLVWDSPEERLADFQEVFGDNLGQLDKQFVRYMTQRGLR